MSLFFFAFPRIFYRKTLIGSTVRTGCDGLILTVKPSFTHFTTCPNESAQFRSTFATDCKSNCCDENAINYDSVIV